VTYSAGELAHYANIVTAAYRLCGPGGAYHGMVTRQLPEDLDLAVLEPLLPAGVPLPRPPVVDASYQGLALIRDR
jgi:hypothetical protein